MFGIIDGRCYYFSQDDTLVFDSSNLLRNKQFTSRLILKKLLHLIMTQSRSLNPYLSKFILLCLVFTYSFSFAQSQNNYNLLWKIEGKQMTSPSYLFGTMHVDDARAFQFSDAVMPAIKSCEVFALEINPDSLSFALSSKIITENPKAVFKSVLSDSEYERLVNRFIEINGFSFEDSQIKDPNVILTLLYPDDDKKDDKSTYVDMYLVGQAKTMRKSITGLEALETQLNHFESLDKDEKRAYIMDRMDGTIREIDSIKNRMTEIYKSGDIYEIQRFINSDLGGTDDSMIERNKVMCASIDKIIKKRSLFSAVGAAHLPGEYGVINLLKKEGYKVTPVIAEFTGVAETYKIDESEFDWYTFKDEELGYLVEIPDAPNYTKDSDKYTIETYTSLLDGTIYMMFGMDFRTTPGSELPLRSLIDRYLESLGKNYDGKIVKSEEVEVDGVTHVKNTLITQEHKTVRSQMTVKGKMIYYLTVQMDSAKSNMKSVDRFFNSLKLFTPKPVEVANTDWQEITYKDAAFSISVPGEPRDLSRETPNPDDLEGDPYQINMYNVLDEANEDNYLFRYNDLPYGYYMQNPEEGFSSMYDNMMANGTAVSEPKVIYLNGYEGREYEVLLRQKYHTFIRVYFRGNRTYLLLYQKLNETDKASLESPFFTEFKFLDYNPKSLETYTIKDKKLEFKKFGNIKTLVDTEDYDTSYLKNSHEFYTTDPQSGDVYQFGYGDFQDYFKTDNLNDFYDLNLETLKNWNDTIIDKRYIKVGDMDGVEAYIKGRNSKAMSKHQIWIQNKRLYMFTAFTAQEDYNKKVTDSIFGSFRDQSKRISFDIYSSKTSLIMKDLKSKDSITRNRALGAFDYYIFDKEDLPQLHKALGTNFGNPELNETIRIKILGEFYDLNDENTLKVVKALYKDSKSSEEIKAIILSLVHQLDGKDAIPTYLEYLFENPPQAIDDYEWLIFKPLRDSVPLTLAHFDKFAELTNKEAYRNNVLSISADLLLNKKDSSGIVKKHINQLLKFSKEDLANYITSVEDTTNYDYTYNGRIYNYLRFMESQSVDQPTVDDFTSQLINRADNDWFKTNAAVSRIKNELPIEASLRSGLIDSMSSRYRMMKAYHDMNQFDTIPERYKSIESMSTLSLNNYLEDGDEYGYKLELLGTLHHDEQDYYGASITYEYDTGVKESYFALIGPVHQVAQSEVFDLFEITMDWSELSEDWKTQALDLLKESKEED